VGHKKGYKPTPQEVEAGRRNLQTWKDSHPGESNFSHGAYSSTVRKRYSDKRTTEGKALQCIVDGLVMDCGGNESLTQGQHILLGLIRSQLITVLQIGKYLDTQSSLIDATGEQLPILNKVCTHNEALRRTIESFYAMNKFNGKNKPPDLGKYLKGKYGS